MDTENLMEQIGDINIATTTNHLPEEEKVLFTQNRFGSFFQELIRKLVPPTEKYFNYKLLIRNELSVRNVLEIPPLDIDNKLLPKCVGMCIVTETVNQHYYILEQPISDIKLFVEVIRFRDYPLDYLLDTGLLKFSLFVGNGYGILIYDIGKEQFLYNTSRENLFKVIQFCYDATSFAFLSPKLLYYRKGDIGGGVENENTVICFYVELGLPTVSYLRYLVSNYGICPAKEFRTIIKRKLRGKRTVKTDN